MTGITGVKQGPELKLLKIYLISLNPVSPLDVFHFDISEPKPNVGTPSVC